jgi:hypothetical protein
VNKMFMISPVCSSAASTHAFSPGSKQSAHLQVKPLGWRLDLNAYYSDLNECMLSFDQDQREGLVSSVAQLLWVVAPLAPTQAWGQIPAQRMTAAAQWQPVVCSPVQLLLLRCSCEHGLGLPWTPDRSLVNPHAPASAASCYSSGLPPHLQRGRVDLIHCTAGQAALHAAHGTLLRPMNLMSRCAAAEGHHRTLDSRIVKQSQPNSVLDAC